MTDELDQDLLARELQRLCLVGVLPRAEVRLSDDILRQLGFEVESAHVRLPASVELLDADRIRNALSQNTANWLQDLELLPVTGSTNTLLLDRARSQSIHGVVTTAELQIAGRGRRGRRWLSPIGQNLALSVGMLMPFEPSAMGGFSLSIGLAVVDVLESAGAASVQVKWPNDVLLNQRKVAGILVELTGHDAGTQVVIGVGVNVRMPAATLENIEQPVADLSALSRPVSRNALAGQLISSIVDYAQGFAERGFASMRDSFNSHHAYHEQPCRLILANDEIAGVVKGVTEQGELLLYSAGRITAYSSGEVSLRQRES